MVQAPQSWRNARNTTIPQNRFLDALTCRGEFKDHFAARDGIRTPHALYGGAGFGGKSYGLRTATMELNGTLRDEGFPGCWGSLICKKYSPDLSDIHLKRLEVEFEGLGRLKKTHTRGLFYEFMDPSLGGFYLRNADDPKKRRGVEYDWMLVDELTLFEREDYDHLKYMLRSNKRLPFKSFGAATNPDGIGHAWVKQWWVERDFSDVYELVDQGLVDPNDYVFVPARAMDNPAFDLTVQANLMGFHDPMLVKARWEGSWEIATGTRFSQFNRHMHTFDWDEFKKHYRMSPGQNVEAALADPDMFWVYGSFDFGTSTSSASAFYLHAVGNDGSVWTFGETYLQGRYLQEQVDVLLSVCEPYKVQRIYCDPSLVGKDSDGISRFYKFREGGVYMTPGINDRVEGWATLDGFLSYPKDETGVPVGKPRWRIHNSCRNLIRQMASAPRDEIRPEDVDRRFAEDHALDSVRYFFHSYFRRPPTLEDNKPNSYEEAWLQDRMLGRRGKRSHGTRTIW